MKLLLFDIDGTLIHSGGAGSRALNRACESLYGIADACSLVRLDGMTDRAIVREILRKCPDKAPQDVATVDRILDTYLQYLRQEVPKAQAYRVLPGIVELLEALKGHANCHLFLATGNLRQGAEIKLARADLNRFFRDGGFGCDAEIRAELVAAGVARAEKVAGCLFDKNQTFVVGDTQHDINAGKALGLQTVAVATGSYTESELANYKPDFLLKDLASTKRVLEIFLS